jgi:hypothetical protein
MKNLNLAAYGVAEMNPREMKATEGGFLLAAGILLLGAAILVINYRVCIGKWPWQ